MSFVWVFIYQLKNQFWAAMKKKDIDLTECLQVIDQNKISESTTVANVERIAVKFKDLTPCAQLTLKRGFHNLDKRFPNAPAEMLRAMCLDPVLRHTYKSFEAFGITSGEREAAEADIDKLYARYVEACIRDSLRIEREAAAMAALAARGAEVPEAAGAAGAAPPPAREDSDDDDGSATSDDDDAFGFAEKAKNFGHVSMNVEVAVKPIGERGTDVLKGELMKQLADFREPALEYKFDPVKYLLPKHAAMKTKTTWSPNDLFLFCDGDRYILEVVKVRW